MDGDLHRDESVGNSSDFSQDRAVPLDSMTSAGMSSLTTTTLNTVASVRAATSVGMRLPGSITSLGTGLLRMAISAKTSRWGS